MKQTIIFGNIITMDEKRPFAKAALVKDGVFETMVTTSSIRALWSPIVTATWPVTAPSDRQT